MSSAPTLAARLLVAGEYRYRRGQSILSLTVSTSLNYFTWVRGSAATFDDWEYYGGTSWTWNHIKDYFDKSATYHDDEGLYPPELKKIGNKGGPLPIAHARDLEESKVFRDALKKGWKSKGEELTVDVFSGEQKGLFPSVNTVYDGVRSTSAVFLEGKKNITILSGTTSKKINFVDTTAVSVTVIGPDHREYTFYADREIVVAQGVYESAKLLMLSGIGNKAELAEFSIPCLIESRHVGLNLLDHPIFSHVFKIKDGTSLDDYLIHPGPKNDAAFARYKKDKTGPYSSPLLELVAFPRIDERLNKIEAYRKYKAENGGLDPFGPKGQPHFEVDFVPLFADAFQWHFPTPPTGNYLTVIVDLMRPVSKSGYVKLNSIDPFEQPYVNINFFKEDLDLLAMREGVRFIDDILYTGEGIRDIVESDYPWPLNRKSDEELDKQILERSQTGFHPCGTLRMAKTIAEGVVDPELRVHGAKNLRVMDASIFPIIPDCRIQNVVYMVGEKGADMIKAAHPDLYK